MALDPQTQVKIDSVRAAIEHSNLTYEMKEYYHDYLTRAAQCANGSANKIDDMSKVLLSVVMGLTMRELTASEELRAIIREELKTALDELKCHKPSKKEDQPSEETPPKGGVDITFKMRMSQLGQQVRNNAAVIAIVTALLALDKIKIEHLEKLLSLFK